MKVTIKYTKEEVKKVETFNLEEPSLPKQGREEVTLEHEGLDFKVNIPKGAENIQVLCVKRG